MKIPAALYVVELRTCLFAHWFLSLSPSAPSLQRCPKTDFLLISKHPLCFPISRPLLVTAPPSALHPGDVRYCSNATFLVKSFPIPFIRYALSKLQTPTALCMRTSLVVQRTPPCAADMPAPAYASPLPGTLAGCKDSMSLRLCDVPGPSYNLSHVLHTCAYTHTHL